MWNQYDEHGDTTIRIVGQLDDSHSGLSPPLSQLDARTLFPCAKSHSHSSNSNMGIVHTNINHSNSKKSYVAPLFATYPFHKEDKSRHV